VALISAAAKASLGVQAGMLAAQRIGGLSCQLSGLVGRMADGCPAGLVEAQRLVALPSGGSGNGSSSLAVTVAGGPSGGDSGGSAGGSHQPAAPGPGSAPGGAAGVGSAAGGSGLGLSAFLTLAGLLLLAPLRALRRLRLSCQPLLTACFVLIPERPG
jgi:hypothetical protein